MTSYFARPGFAMLRKTFVNFHSSVHKWASWHLSYDELWLLMTADFWPASVQKGLFQSNVLEHLRFMLFCHEWQNQWLLSWSAPSAHTKVAPSDKPAFAFVSVLMPSCHKRKCNLSSKDCNFMWAHAFLTTRKNAIFIWKIAFLSRLLISYASNIASHKLFGS